MFEVYILVAEVKYLMSL